MKHLLRKSLFFSCTKKNVLIIIIFLFSEIGCMAQNINTGNKLHAGKNIILNVKQFSQFISRFNYDEDFYGNPVNDEFKKHFSRNQYIRFLFNVEDKRMGTESIPSNYDGTINDFITFVTKDSLRINRLSDKIFALTACEVVYNGTNQTLYLTLHIEKMNDGYRWAIFDANAKFIHPNDMETTINQSAGNDEELMFIPPTSNEINFSHLRKVFEDKSNLVSYISKQSNSKNLNAFINQLQNNNLDFKFVKKVQYYIFDIPGWVIQVAEFNRDTENSGWLINDLGKYQGDSRLYMQELIKKM